jgi:hypothetical protein
MKKLLNLFVLIMLVTISCSDEQNLKKEESLVDSFLKSEAFKDLRVNQIDLNIANAKIMEIDDVTKSVVIPYHKKLKYVISERISTKTTINFGEAFVFEYKTDLSYESVSESLRQNSLTAEISVVSSRDNSFQLFVVDGEFKILIPKFKEKGRVQKCRGTVGSDTWSRDVAGCAAGRIDDMNWFDWTICVIDIPLCWAQNLVSCVIDDCEKERSIAP